MHIPTPAWRAGLASLVMALVTMPAAAQQTGSVTGTVVDKSGRQPLNGAQVSIDGTQLGTLTDARGRYTITNLPAGSIVLRATYIGYRSESQTATVTAGQAATAAFELGVSAVSLNEVVVTGTASTGTERKQLGATVSSVSVSAVQERVPVVDVGSVLQSRLPGVRSIGTVGGVGATRDLRIRGTSSANLTQRPVIYIDGVKVDNNGQEWGSGMGTSCCSFSGGAGVDRLSDLNPNDIDRIEVIKGAAAGTLYGSEATNGVIQIFTKKGRSDSAPRWTIQATGGYQRVRENLPTTLYPNFLGSDGTRAHDPNKSLLENGPYTALDGTVQGGSNTSTYFLSAGYVNEQGSIQPNWMKRGNLRLNLHWLASQKVSFDVTSAYTRNRIFELQQGNNWNALLGNTLYGAPYNACQAGGLCGADGTPRPYGEPWASVVALKAMETTNDVNRWTGGVTMNYNVTSNFTNKIQLGLDALSEERARLQPFGYAYQFVPDGEKGLLYRNFRSVTAEYLGSVSFEEILPRLSTRLSFGAQGFQTVDRRNSAVGKGYAAPGVTTVNGGRVTTGAEQFEEVVQVGYFGQNRLAFADKLFLTTGVRIDGNSAFGQDYGYQVYPNAQLSYDLSSEPWIPSFISNLRLRGALGTAGLAPGAFDRLLTFTPFQTGDDDSGVRPSSPGNVELGPERTTEIEAGFEAGLLNERIGLDFTVYRRNTQDAILEVQLPFSQRFGSNPRSNIGEILDQGYELSLRLTPIESSRLRWSADLRFDGNHNEITDLGRDLDTDSTVERRGNYRVRYPVRHNFQRVVCSEKYLREVAADGTVIRNGACASAQGYNPTTRRFTLTDSTVFLGRSLPGFNASLGNELTFGAFRLYALVSLEQGAWFSNGTRDQSIVFRTHDDYLKYVGEAGSPDCLSATSFIDASRRYCETAKSDSVFRFANTASLWNQRDHVRLREISLGYVVPESFSNRLGLGRTMLTFAGQNLHWWDKCQCIDPSGNYQGGDDDGLTSNYLANPQPRMFKFSVRTSF
ncbi:MAG: TonB-dependent receptor domain-containing protein [Longimicrobiales bacterium]